MDRSGGGWTRSGEAEATERRAGGVGGWGRSDCRGGRRRKRKGQKERGEEKDADFTRAGGGGGALRCERGSRARAEEEERRANTDDVAWLPRHPSSGAWCGLFLFFYIYANSFFVAQQLFLRREEEDGVDGKRDGMLLSVNTSIFEWYFTEWKSSGCYRNFP